MTAEFARLRVAEILHVLIFASTLFLSSPAPSAAQTKRFVYFSTTGYSLDSATGSLTPNPGFVAPRTGGQRDSAILPSGKFLYVITASNTVSGFSINPTTGALTELPSSPYSGGAPSTPKGIVTDATGRFVFVIGEASGSTIAAFTLTGYRVNQITGELAPTDSSVRQNGAMVDFGVHLKINSIYIYVNIIVPPGSYPIPVVYGYSIDPVNGTLTGQAVGGGLGNQARAMAISPKGTYLFTGHGSNRGFIETSITGSSLGASKDLGVRQFPVSMAMDSEEKFLYVTINPTGPNSHLHGYSVDATPGGLTELPLISPFTGIVNLADSVPLTADPSGPFLYAYAGGGLRGYKIGPNGSLTEVPGSPFGTFAGRMTIARTPVQPITGPAAVLSRYSAQFSALDVGATSPEQPIDLGNIGTLPLTNISVSLDNVLDFRQTNGCPATLLPDQKCTINIVFKPLTEGLRSGTLSVSSNAGAPQSASLSGFARLPQVPVPAITLDRTSVDFPPTVVGTTGAGAAIKVTNSGQAILYITGVSIGGPNGADFLVQSNSCTAPVPVNGSCTVTPAFKPTTLGIRSGTLAIAGNASATVSLLGNGNSPPFKVEPPPGAPPSATTASVTAGQPAEYSLQLTPERDSVATIEVSLSCSGVPRGANCVVPAKVTSTNGNVTPFRVTVTTTARAGVFPPVAGPFLTPLGGLFATALSLATLAMLTFSTGRRAGRITRPLWSYGALTVALAALLAAAACGGGNNFVAPPPPPGGTPAGAFTVTVTATSNTTTQQLPLTLIVQ